MWQIKGLTRGVDTGHAVCGQDQVLVAVTDDAVLALVAFAAFTVAAVLNGADDHLSVSLYDCWWENAEGTADQTYLQIS